MRTTSSISSARAVPSVCALAFMAHHGFGDLLADRVDRIERQRRLLEDHRDGLAAKRRQRVVVQRQHVASEHVDRAGDLRALASAAAASARAASRSCPSRIRRAARAPRPRRATSETPLTAWTVRSPVKRTLRLRTSTTIAHGSPGTCVVEIGGALECRADPRAGSPRRRAGRSIACRPAGRLAVKPAGIESDGRPR